MNRFRAKLLVLVLVGLFLWLGLQLGPLGFSPQKNLQTIRSLPTGKAAQALANEELRPFEENPLYWQYRGKPIMLLGGSAEDNLFQLDGLEEHLDTLIACGGNYVRMTLSSRDEGNVWPFAMDPQSGLYDLDKPSSDYFSKLKQALDLCLERDIIAQIEIWDRFDYARDPWLENPYNPKNNRNYTVQNSGLEEIYSSHPGRKENPFFRSIPGLENNALLLAYQKLHFGRILETTLEYPNVLYCVSNETNESPEWGKYWTKVAQEVAKKKGRVIAFTEMWDDRGILNEQHDNTLLNPNDYAFVDISQNNHQKGYKHWTNLQLYRAKMASTGLARPINMVKVYGANTYRFGTAQDGQQRFWRSLLGGVAAIRFHRPNSGLGLSFLAQANLESARLALQHFDIFSSDPDALVDSVRDKVKTRWLKKSSENEAYAIANDNAIMVYFPGSGSVAIDPSFSDRASFHIMWIDVQTAVMLEPETVRSQGEAIELITPNNLGPWVAIVSAIE